VTYLYYVINIKYLNFKIMHVLKTYDSPIFMNVSDVFSEILEKFRRLVRYTFNIIWCQTFFFINIFNDHKMTFIFFKL
jgi:hypothetical protein